MSEPNILALARSYVEWVDAHPDRETWCTSEKPTIEPLSRALIEFHDKHERLLMVLRDRCDAIIDNAPHYATDDRYPASTFAREVLRLIGVPR